MDELKHYKLPFATMLISYIFADMFAIYFEISATHKWNFDNMKFPKFV